MRTPETELWASATPRDVADDLIGEVLSMHGRRGVRAVSACIVANLKAAGVNLSAPSCPPSSWRMQEACLNVLTRVAQGLLIEAKRDASGDDAGKGGKGKKKKKKKPLPLTVESVLPYLTTCVSAMPHIATACQAAQAAGTSTDTILGMSFVLGRALSAVSRLAPAIPEAQCFVVLKAAIDGLAVRLGVFATSPPRPASAVCRLFSHTRWCPRLGAGRTFNPSLSESRRATRSVLCAPSCRPHSSSRSCPLRWHVLLPSRRLRPRTCWCSC